MCGPGGVVGLVARQVAEGDGGGGKGGGETGEQHILSNQSVWVGVAPSWSFIYRLLKSPYWMFAWMMNKNKLNIFGTKPTSTGLKYTILFAVKEKR